MEGLKRVRIAKEMEDPYYLKEEKLLELYKKCLPPIEAYYCFPTSDDIVIYNQKKPKKTFRRIFYNVPYNDQEHQWISEFKQMINSHQIQLPDYFGDYLLLTFIYSVNCNLEKARKNLENYLNFCKKTFPLVLTPKSKIREILNRGFVYVYGRDIRFKPIIICQCKVFEKYYKDYACEEILLATYFLCQFIVNNMLIPGQFESWIFLINLNGVSIISLPEPIKKLIRALSDYFLSRLYKNFIFGLNFLTRILYKFACNFLDPITVKKINILDKIGDPIIFKTIRKDNLEQQFGGTAPNLPVDEVDGFFPPRMPSEHFIRDDENKDSILISEEEYINKYKSGLIPEECVSPYIYNKLKEKPEQNLEMEEQIDNPPEIVNNEEEKILEQKISDNQPLLIHNEIQNSNNNQFMKIDSSLVRINYEKEKFKRVVNYNWNYGDETSLPIYHNINSSKLNDISNDINQFGNKRKKFFENICSFN
jgi:hypothetical protein